VHSRRFCLEKFQEELTGPEYAHRYLKMAETVGVDFTSTPPFLKWTKTECSRW